MRNAAASAATLLAIACITQWYVHVQSGWGEHIRRTESPFYHPTGAGYVMTDAPAPPGTPDAGAAPPGAAPDAPPPVEAAEEKTAERPRKAPHVARG